jgi:folylpolyglutamate synthase/dihydropteroate synthase
VPAVIGEPSRDIRALLVQLARDAGATPVRAVGADHAVEDNAVDADGTRFTLRRGSGAPRRLHTPLVGRYQAYNAATALAMLECAGAPWCAAAADAERALTGVGIPGRFQRCGDIIFDVAHNPASSQVLRETLEAVRPRRPIVCLLTVLGDKDWHAMMETLAGVVDRFVLCAPPSFPSFGYLDLVGAGM